MSPSDHFARAALQEIPKILTLQDRNPHSPTYGCFDRNYWHYKIIDFPSGMAQEFVWPLALVHETAFEGNRYHRQPAVRACVEAGIEFAARSAHADGSCDDYFPFERASGAAAFSLLAAIESCTLLGLERQDFEAFFRKRADWLARHHESGRLTNHQALIALGLTLLGRRQKTDRWDGARRERLERVLAWQDEEGWFQEYDGCDPGYHTLTVFCLARLLELDPGDERLRDALRRAVKLAAEFVHPDGSFGGEYTSRNTYNYFPAGFELVGSWMPEALAINDRFLAGLVAGRGACYSDDHILGHHAWNYLLAARHFVTPRPVPAPRAQGRAWFPRARILIDRRGSTELYAALNKGGAFKLFRDGRLVCSDTQVSLQVRDGGRLRNAVGHMVGDSAADVQADRVTIRGRLAWAKQKRMDVKSLVLLRAFMLTVGRFFPNLVRRLLQKMLIVGRAPAPFAFTRTFTWEGERLRVRDEVSGGDWSAVEAAGLGGHQTSIYVVMSRTFQEGQLQPWQDLTPDVRRLEPGGTLVVERTL